VLKAARRITLQQGCKRKECRVHV